MTEGDKKFIELCNRLRDAKPVDIEAEGKENFCECLRNALGQLNRYRIPGRFKLMTEIRMKLDRLTQAELV